MSGSRSSAGVMRVDSCHVTPFYLDGTPANQTFTTSFVIDGSNAMTLTPSFALWTSLLLAMYIIFS